ncbi:MAG: hypothetical protein ACON4E_07875 [Flavobacteriales bacterium]
MPIDDIQLTDDVVYVSISGYDQKLLVVLPIDRKDAGLMYTLELPIVLLLLTAMKAGAVINRLKWEL